MVASSEVTISYRDPVAIKNKGNLVETRVQLDDSVRSAVVFTVYKYSRESRFRCNVDSSYRFFFLHYDL